MYFARPPCCCTLIKFRIFFFKITELHGITRLLQVNSTGITLTSGGRTAALLVRYGNKKSKVDVVFSGVACKSIYLEIS